MEGAGGVKGLHVPRKPAALARRSPKARACAGCRSSRTSKSPRADRARPPRPAGLRRAHRAGRHALRDPRHLRQARDPRRGCDLRPGLVLEPAAAGPRCAGRAAAPVRKRDRRAGGPHRPHRDAQPAWRLRVRPDHHPARRRALHDRHRLGPGNPRRRPDHAPHRTRRTRSPDRRERDGRGVVGDRAAQRVGACAEGAEGCGEGGVCPREPRARRQEFTPGRPAGASIRSSAASSSTTSPSSRALSSLVPASSPATTK